VVNNKHKNILKSILQRKAVLISGCMQFWSGIFLAQDGCQNRAVCSFSHEGSYSEMMQVASDY
jgi:hypothetical protein